MLYPNGNSGRQRVNYQINDWNIWTKLSRSSSMTSSSGDNDVMGCPGDSSLTLLRGDVEVRAPWCCCSLMTQERENCLVSRLSFSAASTSSTVTRTGRDIFCLRPRWSRISVTDTANNRTWAVITDLKDSVGLWAEWRIMVHAEETAARYDAEGIKY